MSEVVRIVEVGPRDGLQNEAVTVSPEARIRFVEMLVDAGLRSIEVGSFVSPKWVPQMANTDAVLKGLSQRPGVDFPVLVPNEKGLDGALASGAREIAVFASASEAFSQKNINCSIAESIERFRPVAERANAGGIKLRGYVSCVLGCPYQGDVPVADVIKVTSDLIALGCYEVSLGDTIGVGTPKKSRDIVRAVSDVNPVTRLAAHFHDTYGQALANLHAVLEQGIRTVDAAAGGLGGCPYAKGASGNVATEAVVYMLDGMGENGGGKLDHGSGWIVRLRAAQKSSTFSLFCTAQGGTRDLHRGIISEGSSRLRRRYEPARSIKAFRHIARHCSQDDDVFGSAGLSAAGSGSASEAGSVHPNYRRVA